MLDKNQIKSAGIRYARSLQVLFKTVSMFSADHSAASGPLQNSFDQLNNLLKQMRQFTLGFVDQRVMINNILTAERSLTSLENEFLKRGIGAVTFEAGMTLAAYRRGIAVMTRSPKVIEEQGGLNKYLEQNPIDFMRIFSASKSQMRNESGDTILDMDSESYLMAKALSDIRPMAGFDKMEWLLQGGPGGGGGGTGSGTGFGGGGSGSGTGMGFAGGSGDGTGFGGGTGNGNGNGNGAGDGFGGEGYGSGSVGSGVAAAGASGGVATGVAPAPDGSGPSSIQNLVEGYFESTLMDTKDTPQRSYQELARVIQEMRPEFVLSAFPPKRRDELRQMPPDQMAAEIVEDTAVKWAVDRLVTAPQGPEAVIVEEEVVRVLLRSLQATQMAGRLADKLAQFVREYQIPKSTYDRIQAELHWVVVPPKEKTQRLLQIEHFSQAEFRRLLEHMKEVIKSGDLETATKLGNHYFAMFDHAGSAPKPEELSRMPELLRAMAGVRTDFWEATAVRLTDALNRWPDEQFLHRQIINGLSTLAKNVALYEEFSLIQSIGNALESLRSRNEAHEDCCGKALETLLTPNAVDRIMELHISKRGDATWARTASTLLRWSGNLAVAKVFRALEDEQVTANRLALIRLIRSIGPGALDFARKQLSDDRWYVVRNACKLLGDLKDPEMLRTLAPVLRHSDERVQKAATVALIESRNPGRAEVFADALPYLQPQVLEEVLGELLFLKDPVAVPALERFIFRDAHGKTKLLMQAVQTLAGIPGEASAQLLGHVLADSTLDTPLRRMALNALSRIQSETSGQLLREFGTQQKGDPLANECAQALGVIGK